MKEVTVTLSLDNEAENVGPVDVEDALGDIAGFTIFDDNGNRIDIVSVKLNK